LGLERILYDSLDERLTKTLATTTKLTYAALNPYAQENYFCLFDDSSCAFQFPETDDFQVLEKLIHDGDPIRVIIDSPTLRQSSDVVKVVDGNKGSDSGKDGVVKTVMEKAAEEGSSREKPGEGIPEFYIGGSMSYSCSQLASI
jgi:hypothetical protein